MKIAESEITRFALKLEAVGYQDALDLVKLELVPMALERGLTLIQAANLYASDEAEQDTSAYQLWEALRALKSL